MIEFIITSAILILLVILVRAIFAGRISRRVCYAMWLLVVIKLLLPGVPNYFNVMNVLSSFTAEFEKNIPSAKDAGRKTAVSDANDDSNAIKMPDDKKAQIADNQNVQTAENEIEPEGQQNDTESPGRVLLKRADTVWNRDFHTASVLGIIWLVGSGIAVCIMLTSNLVFRKRLYKSRRIAEGISPYHKLLVYVTGEVKIPCLYGLWHPAIYIPEEFPDKDAKTLEMVMMHETVHYCHMDYIWSFIRCLLLVIYWWNPLVYLTVGLSVVDSELACDEGVIARLGEKSRKTYGESLIAIGSGCKGATGLFVCGAGLSGRKGELKIRMKYLAAKRRKNVSALVLACVLLVGAAGCTFGGAAGQDMSSKEEEGEKRKDTGTQEQAYEGGGRMLVQDMEIIEGAEEWIAFKRAAIAGKGTEEKPLDITIESQIDGETYTDELSFDGTSFLFDGRKWKYLLDLDGMSGMPERKSRTVVLANEIVTYEEVEWSLMSSQSYDWIDCDILFFANGGVEGDKVCYLGAEENGEGVAKSESGENSSAKETFEPREGEINVGYSPVAFGDQSVRYFVPDTDVVLEEKLSLALQNFLPKKEAENGSVEGKHSLGCSVYYDGIEWELFSGNCLVAWIENEDGEGIQVVETPELDWLCVNISTYVLDILKSQKDYEPADVTKWTKLTSATLDYMDSKTKKRTSQTITDKESLNMLGQWFSGAEVVNGGTGCPFHQAMLTITLENGEKASMMMAEDDCPVFQINGVYYDYSPEEFRLQGWANDPFKKLFDEIPFEY